MFQIKDDGILTDHGSLLKEPAVMFNKITGTLHYYGDVQIVKDFHAEWAKADKDNTLMGDIVVYEFDKSSTSLENICSLMNRMNDISGYCAMFYKWVMTKQFDKLFEQ